MPFISHYILGVLEDNTLSLWFGNLYKIHKSFHIKWFNYPFGIDYNPSGTNEPFIWYPYRFLISKFDTVSTYNLFIIFTFLLSGLFSWFFFKRYIKKNLVSIFLSFIFTFSPFFWYQLRSHVSITQIWFLLLVLIFFLDSDKKTIFHKFLGGVLIVILIGISNYLGYFVLLFMVSYIAIKFILTIGTKGLAAGIKTFSSYVLMFVTVITFSLIFLAPYFRVNYRTAEPVDQSVTKENIVYTYVDGERTRIVGDSWRLMPNYSFFDNFKYKDTRKIDNSLEEFFYFGSRPWYYFLPSPENPWFGNFTNTVISSLQKGWGYWLTSNYFPSEHTASFLGWTNLFFAIIGSIYIVKRAFKVKPRRKNTSDNKIETLKLGKWGNSALVRNFSIKIKNLRQIDVENNYFEILILGFVALFLALLTMPPYFTISLHRIYMPSYLLWELFPMFRVLARLGIIVLLIELVFTGYGYISFLQFIKRKIENKKLLTSKVLQSNTGRKVKNLSSVIYKSRNLFAKNWTFTSFLILLPVFTLSLMEFYVPVKVTNISTAPKVYSYINKETPSESVIAIYPYSKTNDGFFWMKEYQRPLINPKGHEASIFDFSSKDFTFDLNSCKGILEAYNLGTDYIVYFYKEDKAAAKDFFDSTNLLFKEKEFVENGKDTQDLGLWNTFITVVDAGTSESNSSLIYKLNKDFDYSLEKEKCLESLKIVKQ